MLFYGKTIFSQKSNHFNSPTTTDTLGGENQFSISEFTAGYFAGIGFTEIKIAIVLLKLK